MSKRSGPGAAPVRERVLRDGKLLYMAVPRLADALPFYVLDPARLGVPPAEAASREGAERAAQKVSVGEMRPIQLVVCGSVAVNRAGARLGKGAGYSDIEVALIPVPVPTSSTSVPGLAAMIRSAKAAG